MSLIELLDVPAPAKINLFLRVVGRRADGYHLLQSPFVLIDWMDTLHFERRIDGRLQRHDLGPALPDDDLCLRAARTLQAASGTRLGADIHIDKQVPWGAGMGGGSSDAATTLLALNRLWGLHWSRVRLAELGLSLGADVPFFVGGHNAWVEGVGERLTPMTVPPLRLAVVKPPVTIHTADLFGRLQVERDHEADIVMGSLENALDLAWCQRQPNDLQAVAERLCPEVAEAARWLQVRYGNSRMTGSGSAVFARLNTGNCETLHAAAPGALWHGADTVALPLATFPAAELPPGWVGKLCSSLAGHPLRGWAD